MTIVARNIPSVDIKNPLAKATPYPTISIASSNIDTPGSITPSASRNIEVLSPLTGDSVRSGFLVKGNARTFENVVNIRLSDSNGNILIETNTIANAPDTGQFGPFDKTITFTTDDNQGTLEVFQYSAKDGSEIDKVVIPLVLSN
jgi:hypothetical protein